jgi:hypothetical protein
MPRECAGTDDRLARIERMIEHYRFAKSRRQVQRAIALWRKIEAQEALADFEKPPERIH